VIRAYLSVHGRHAARPEKFRQAMAHRARRTRAWGRIAVAVPAAATSKSGIHLRPPCLGGRRRSTRRRDGEGSEVENGIAAQYLLLRDRAPRFAEIAMRTVGDDRLDFFNSRNPRHQRMVGIGAELVCQHHAGHEIARIVRGWLRRFARRRAKAGSGIGSGHLSALSRRPLCRAAAMLPTSNATPRAMSSRTAASAVPGE